MNSSIPTLEELLTRLKFNAPQRIACYELYRQVAAGERHPNNPPLPDNVVRFACQAMAILFHHVESENETNHDQPTD